MAKYWSMRHNIHGKILSLDYHQILGSICLKAEPRRLVLFESGLKGFPSGAVEVMVVLPTGKLSHYSERRDPFQYCYCYCYLILVIIVLINVHPHSPPYARSGNLISLETLSFCPIGGSPSPLEYHIGKNLILFILIFESRISFKCFKPLVC